MAFCTRCGSTVAEGVAICQQCGAPTGPVTVGPPLSAAPAATATGIQENVAGLLCYLVGWITGIVFLMIDKRPFVRFHAAQSIVVFGALTILRIVVTYGLLEGMFGWHSLGMLGLWSLLSMLIGLFTLILWILLMVTAYQGKTFEIPIAAPFARKLAGSSKI